MLIAGAALLALAALQTSAGSIAPVVSAQASAASVSPEPVVSVTRIRQRLERQNQLLKFDVPETTEPMFRTAVQGQRIQAVLDALDFNGGPMPPGGLYAFEQSQLLGNPWAGRPIVEVNVLPLVAAAYRAIRSAHHEHADRAAHEEVQRALIAFCETQTNCPSR